MARFLGGLLILSIWLSAEVADSSDTTGGLRSLQIDCEPGIVYLEFTDFPDSLLAFTLDENKIEKLNDILRESIAKTFNMEAQLIAKKELPKYLRCRNRIVRLKLTYYSQDKPGGRLKTKIEMKLYAKEIGVEKEIVALGRPWAEGITSLPSWYQSLKMAVRSLGEKIEAGDYSK